MQTSGFEEIIKIMEADKRFTRVQENNEAPASLQARIDDIDDGEILEAVRDGALGSNDNLLKAYKMMKQGYSKQMESIFDTWIREYFEYVESK